MLVPSVVVVLSLLCHVAAATLWLPHIISDNMVLQTNLQSGHRPQLWGSAAPGESVVLTGAPSRTADVSQFTAVADSAGQESERGKMGRERWTGRREGAGGHRRTRRKNKGKKLEKRKKEKKEKKESSTRSRHWLPPKGRI